MSSAGFPTALGDVVRQHRVRLGWSQRKLAQEAGVSETTIRNMERRRTSTGYKISHVAAALGVNVGALIDEASRAEAVAAFPKVGEFIAMAMERRGLSVAQMARRMMVEESDVRQLLDGEAGPIMWGTAAVALEINPRLIQAIAEGRNLEDAYIDSDVAEWLRRGNQQGR